MNLFARFLFIAVIVLQSTFAFGQSNCTNAIDMNTNTSNAWTVLSGPDKSIAYPYKAYVVSKAANWEQDSDRSKVFENCNWISPYAQKMGTYNTSAEPFVIEYSFYVSASEKVSINFKTLFDNAACFAIDGVPIQLTHPIPALAAAQKAKTWCTGQYLNKSYPYDGSKTMNFTYNASSTLPNVEMQLAEGKHKITVALRSEKNSEIGFVLAGMLSSSKQAVLCKDQPIKIKKEGKDVDSLPKPIDTLKHPGASNWIKATLANVYFKDGSFSILNKRTVSTFDLNRYTYVDASYRCNEKQKDAEIRFTITYPSGTVMQGRGIKDGFTLSEAGTYTLQYEAIFFGKVVYKKQTTIIVEAPEVDANCGCPSAPLFQYQFFDRENKGSAIENLVSYSTKKGKLNVKHQIRHQYYCASFDCKKSGQIVVSDSFENVISSQAYNGLYNFNPTKAGTYHFMITEKCNGTTCEPIYFTLQIEEEEIIAAIEPIDEKWKGEFKLQYRTAKGNEAWKNIERKPNSIFGFSTSSEMISYTHIGGMAVQGSYENALHLPMTLSYALKPYKLIASEIPTFPYLCEANGNLPFNSYASNTLKNQNNKCLMMIYASHKNRIVDSMGILMNTKGYDNTPDYYQLYKIGNAKIAPLALQKHMPENIVTGGTTIYNTIIQLKAIDIDIDYIRINFQIDNKKQSYDTSILGYKASNYVRSNSILMVDRSFVIAFAKQNAEMDSIIPSNAVAKTDYRFENEDSVQFRSGQTQVVKRTGKECTLGRQVSIVPKKGIREIEIPITIVMPGLSTLSNKIHIDKLVINVFVHYPNCEGNSVSYSASFDKQTGKFANWQLIKK